LATVHFNISEVKYNTEIWDGRLYKSVKRGSVSGGVSLAIKLPIPDISVIIPKLLTLDVYLTPSIGLSARDAFIYEKTVELDEDWRQSSFDFGFTASGGL